jgi:DNA-binding transcriptional regulator YhcF (GntR family)
MKRLVLLVSALFLLFLIPTVLAQDKPDAKMLKEKQDRKIAEMKAAGASQEEINAFIAEFKKKVAAMDKAQTQNTPDEKAFMEKVKQKAVDMKAAGASDDEIKKMVTEAKVKWEAKKAKDQNNAQHANDQKLAK